LISDVHWDLYFRDAQLERLIDRLNSLQVDAVVVAGDWTYEPHPDLKAGLAPFARIRHPVFGVLGNHDVEAPGPPLSDALRKALGTHGVQLIEGQMVSWKGWSLVGLDDHWGGAPGPQVESLWPASDSATDWSHRIVVAHQPDTLATLPPDAAFLALAGHTHGGQIWIPGLTEWVVRTTNTVQPWLNGLYQAPSGHVFVTPGIGTIGLPARLGVVPTIDVIVLRR
jgi:predicted MPP superfamily phosphohydrolase